MKSLIPIILAFLFSVSYAIEFEMTETEETVIRIHNADLTVPGYIIDTSSIADSGSYSFTMSEMPYPGDTLRFSNFLRMANSCYNADTIYFSWHGDTVSAYQFEHTPGYSCVCLMVYWEETHNLDVIVPEAEFFKVKFHFQIGVLLCSGGRVDTCYNYYFNFNYNIMADELAGTWNLVSLQRNLVAPSIHSIYPFALSPAYYYFNASRDPC